MVSPAVFEARRLEYCIQWCWCLDILEMGDVPLETPGLRAIRRAPVRDAALGKPVTGLERPWRCSIRRVAAAVRALPWRWQQLYRFYRAGDRPGCRSVPGEPGMGCWGEGGDPKRSAVQHPCSSWGFRQSCACRAFHFCFALCCLLWSVEFSASGVRLPVPQGSPFDTAGVCVHHVVGETPCLPSSDQVCMQARQWANFLWLTVVFFWPWFGMYLLPETKSIKAWKPLRRLPCRLSAPTEALPVCCGGFQASHGGREGTKNGEKKKQEKGETSCFQKQNPAPCYVVAGWFTLLPLPSCHSAPCTLPPSLPQTAWCVKHLWKLIWAAEHFRNNCGSHR